MVLGLPDCWSNWNLAVFVGFWGEGKTEVHEEKPLGAKEPNNNKLNPLMASTPGFEPGPLWWEVSALTAAPPLLPRLTIHVHYKTTPFTSHICCTTDTSLIHITKLHTRAVHRRPNIRSHSVLFNLLQMSEGKTKKSESIAWGSTQLWQAFRVFIRVQQYPVSLNVGWKE